MVVVVVVGRGGVSGVERGYQEGEEVRKGDEERGGKMMETEQTEKQC